MQTKATSSEQPTGYHQFQSIKLSLVARLPQARLKHASCKASAHKELVRSSKRKSGCHASSFDVPPTSRSLAHAISVSKFFARVDYILLSARQIVRQPRVNPSVASASLNLVHRDPDHTCSDLKKPVSKKNHSIRPSIATLSLSNVRHFRKQFVLVIHGRDHFLTTRAPPLCLKKQQDGMYWHHFGPTSPTNTT